MKNKHLPKRILIMSLCSIQVFVLQLVCAGVLLASDDANGQENLANQHKSLKEITVSFQEQNIALKDAFDLIHTKTGLTFAYINSKVPINKKVNIDAANVSLETILLNLSKDANLSFKRINNRIQVSKKHRVIDTSIEEIINVAAQKVTGKITDSTGEGLPGVNVILKGTSIGSITDLNGGYSIEVPDGSAVLVFSSVGYISQEVTVGNQAVIDISLADDVTALNEIVVTALGVEKEKKSLGFSVTEVQGKDIAATQQVNPINALQGKVAGVSIDQGFGGAFGSSRILIRGNSTLSENNQPIFVVDGVIIDNDLVNRGGLDYGNDLKNLNSEDFESVSVLKGSAAAALYGSRAINGVILITTKKGGKREGIGVIVSQNVNVYQPYRGVQFQNEFGGGSVGPNYTDWRDPGYQSGIGEETKVFPVNSNGDPYIDPQKNRELENWGPRFAGQDVLNYDGEWIKWEAQPDNFMNSFHNGVHYNTNVAVEGGSEKTTFRASFVNDDQSAMVDNSSFKKRGFGMRATHKFSKYLEIDASGDYSNIDNLNPIKLSQTNAFDGGNWGKAFSWTFPRNYDTDYWSQPDKYISVLGGTPNPNRIDEPNKVPRPNFWFDLYEQENRQIENMYRGRISLSSNVTDWLKLIAEANFNNVDKKNESKQLGSNPGFEGGSYSISHSQKKSNFFKAMAMFSAPVTSTINLNGYIGAERQEYSNTYNSGSTSGGLLIPANYFLANSVNTPTSDGGIGNRKRLNSVYASVDLDFKDQLFLLATWRGDWSSTLTYQNGTGNNFYNYPAVSLSWVFSETMEMPSAISFAKLRGNVAALGNDTDPFRINSGYSFSGKTLINGSAVSMATFNSNEILSPNIKPERKIASEIGLEMRFMNNKVGFDLSLYQDNTHDQIIGIGVPVESGASSLLINAGNIQNRGIEFTLDAEVLNINKFRWNTSFNIGKNENKIVELHPLKEELQLGGSVSETSAWAVVGGSYGTIRTTIASEKFQATDGNGNPIDHRNNGMPVLALRSDGRTAFPKRSGAWSELGDINPDFRAGWSNDFSYGNFTLGILLDAKVGGDMVLSSYRFGTHTGVLPNTLMGRDADHGGITWTSEYDGITYDDGILADGVFPQGQTYTQPDGSKADVGGMSFVEAYEAGLVEPNNAPQYYYRYGSSSTGVADYWTFESTWVSLRQLSITYSVPRTFCQKLNLTAVSLSFIGRDLFYLYNSLPFDFNPASVSGNSNASVGEQGFTPMTRTLGGGIRVSF